MGSGGVRVHVGGGFRWGDVGLGGGMWVQRGKR